MSVAAAVPVRVAVRVSCLVGLSFSLYIDSAHANLPGGARAASSYKYRGIPATWPVAMRNLFSNYGALIRLQQQ